MLPTDWVYGSWPNSGEIDIMEHVGYDTGTVHGTVHTGAYNHMQGTHLGDSKTEVTVGEWHTYAVDWTVDQIRFMIDGIEYHRFSRHGTSMEWPFDQKFHVILNLAVGGNWGGIMGVDDTAFMGEGQIMEVDWVRIYAPEGGLTSANDTWSSTVGVGSVGIGLGGLALMLHKRRLRSRSVSIVTATAASATCSAGATTSAETRGHELSKQSVCPSKPQLVASQV